MPRGMAGMAADMAGAAHRTGKAAEDADSVIARVRAMLDDWRERGLDRRDAMRFHVMTALAARMDGRAGLARERMAARLAELAAAYQASGESGVGAVPASSNPLSQLLADMAAHAQAAGKQSAHPDQGTLDYFRDLGTRMRIERQARQSLAQTPANAGPLNSAFLAHRALALMHGQSPAYMRRFLSYLDTLACLEAPPAARAKPVRR